MSKSIIKHFGLKTLLLLLYLNMQGQSNIIEFIDFYGLEKVKEAALRNVIGVKEGGTLNYIDKSQQINKLKTVPGVKQADISMVCCTEKGQWGVYIGISEKDNNTIIYHPTPKSKIRLPEEVIKTAAKFYEAFSEGIEKGEAGEDESQGHSFMNYAPAKAIQEEFVIYAAKYLPQLKNVLKNSGNNDQRAIAAQVIAYAKDKNMVVDDLMYAVYDNNEVVRNNATRALSLIAAYGEKNPDLKIKKIPAAPFIKMTNSVIWTDRNKGSAVLLSLTEKRDSVVMKQIKKDALVSIIEMARWKNPGHSMMGYLLLGRIINFSDEDIYKAFYSENKNAFLDAMITKANGK